MTQQLSNIIDTAWDARDTISSATVGEVRDAVSNVLAGLDDGSFRVAEKRDGAWVVNQWLKKAVLLSFRLNDNVVVDGGASGAPAYDKVPSKFAGWG
jgi:2,3,4,5-tetrahydropyridine-2,6-dicarboxylate N-succinyltransferase